ncbi:hypothetical protein MKX03_017040 [Papaver bracteatum]|nr:hypothetical protein MKX03_017040 [Papaver bracteatum]
MTGLKSFLFVFVLVAVMTAAPLAEAQLGGGPVSGIIGLILGLIRVQGTVFCSINGSAGANGTETPAFPNALIQLKCGSSVISSTTTNSAGGFTMLLDPVITLLSNLLSNCAVVVNTLPIPLFQP